MRRPTLGYALRLIGFRQPETVFPVCPYGDTDVRTQKTARRTVRLGQSPPYPPPLGCISARFVLTRWLDLKSTPALAMLPHYWEYSARLPQNFRFPLYAASGLAAVVAVAPLFIILAVLFAKPKRELHGSARFANGAEIAQTGLLKPPAKQEKGKPLPPPAILLGRYKGKFLRWAGSEFLFAPPVPVPVKVCR